MPDLYLHGRAVETPFRLLGLKENAITASLGWTLRQSPTLMSLLLKSVLPGPAVLAVNGIRLQEHATNQGITDIEIEADDLRVIVEAKRGWTLPTEGQLQQYAERKPRLIVVLSECSEGYALARLAPRVRSVEVVHRSWRDIARLTRTSIRNSKLAERRVLDEFLTYMETAMPVQDQESNVVYVVSLGKDTPRGWNISPIDVVEKKGVYFHPEGSGWPKAPPNYVGFRYNGKLQAIRHVDDYEVGTDPHNFVPEISSDDWERHFFYKLGPVIAPTHEVRTGKLFKNGRVWAALDLLLTCKTISEARDETDKRRKQAMG